MCPTCRRRPCLQVVEHRPGRADRRRHIRAAEAIQRLHLEMLAQGEGGLVLREGVAVAARGHLAGEIGQLVRLLVAEQHLARADARQFIFQLRHGLQLREAKLPGAEIDIGEAVTIVLLKKSGEVVVLFRLQQIYVAHCAGADDFRNLARHDLPRLRLAHLVADGDAPACLDQLRDVPRRRVIRDPAHGGAVALGERHIQDAGRFLGIGEEHLVEIPQPKHEERIRRERAPDSLILLHHRGKQVGHGKAER